MAELLTEEDFSKHLHTKFRVRAESPVVVDLELDTVASYQGGDNEQSGMVRFSLFFDGPPNVPLEQGMFTLEHEQLGELLIFLVPIARNASGFRYESVFNYFKK
ncbi:MAG: hypothetical protein LC802_19410 [Acidobacteria bacterium]|nr:hypothetical protein [Acidobacteriota bacterium]